MTVTMVNEILSLMRWLDENVCSKVLLKLPPEKERTRTADAGDYEYRLVHPSVLGMYWPTSSKLLPPDVEHTHPGILVQLTGGQADAKDISSTFRVRFHLSAWSPGTHAGDRIMPSGELSYTAGGGEFAADYSGWMEAWNFADVLIRELRNAKTIGVNLTLDRSQPIEFAPYSEQGAIMDFYPYWFAVVDAVFSAPDATPVSLEDFL